ncbi:MAG: Uma2 family endonuclease [Anaerolineaceae bacterium]|nr:Uma2 family endonuclease [Anaerolineaceae bacterium]
MVLERQKHYTAEEFWAFASLPEHEDKRLELEDGVIIDMGASSPVNTVVAMRIGYFLNAFVIPNDLGYVTGADGGFKLADNRVRQPDVGFIAKARAPQLPKHFDSAPDLAVEVVSPDEDIFKKTNEYLRAGTRQVWAVYPGEQMVYVMQLDADGRMISTPFDTDSTLTGGDILPGFTLAVREVFPD